MIRIKKILVPTDFSEFAKKALTYGFAFARQLDSKLLVPMWCLNRQLSSTRFP